MSNANVSTAASAMPTDTDTTTDIGFDGGDEASMEADTVDAGAALRAEMAELVGGDDDAYNVGDGDGEEGESDAIATDTAPVAATDPAEEDGDPLAKFSNDRKGIRDLREAYKAHTKKLRDAERKLAEYEKRVQEMSQQPQTQPNSPDLNNDIVELSKKYSTEDMLTFLGRYEAGLATGENLDELKVQALEALELKSPAEIQAVLKKARNNGYGNISRDVQLIAAEALAVAQAVGDQRRQQLAQVEGVQVARQRAVMAVRQSLPEAFDKDGKFTASTPVGKEYQSAGEELASVIPGVMQVPEAPEIIHRFMQLKRSEAKASTLEKENAELKARLRKFTGTLPQGQTSGARTAAPSSPRDQLRRELQAAGIVD